MGDWNTLDSDEVLGQFLEERELNNSLKVQTCFTNTENPSAIDLVFTNKR